MTWDAEAFPKRVLGASSRIPQRDKDSCVSLYGEDSGVKLSMSSSYRKEDGRTVSLDYITLN
jgi:hypothetical protein